MLTLKNSSYVSIASKFEENISYQKLIQGVYTLVATGFVQIAFIRFLYNEATMDANNLLIYESNK